MTKRIVIIAMVLLVPTVAQAMSNNQQIVLNARLEWAVRAPKINAATISQLLDEGAQAHQDLGDGLTPLKLTVAKLDPQAFKLIYDQNKKDIQDGKETIASIDFGHGKFHPTVREMITQIDGNIPKMRKKPLARLKKNRQEMSEHVYRAEAGIEVKNTIYGDKPATMSIKSEQTVTVLAKLEEDESPSGLPTTETNSDTTSTDKVAIKEGTSGQIVQHVTNTHITEYFEGDDSRIVAYYAIPEISEEKTEAPRNMCARAMRCLFGSCMKKEKRD